jgi:hypothetical protein
MSTLPFFIAFYRHDLIDVISGSLQGGIYFWREEIGKFFSDSISECVEILLSLPFPSPPPPTSTTQFNSEPPWFMMPKKTDFCRLCKNWQHTVQKKGGGREKYMIVPAFMVIAFSKWFLILLRNSRFPTFIGLESSFDFDWFHLKRRIYITFVIDEITRRISHT